LGIGDWAQSPIPNPQSPIPNPHIFSKIKIKNINYLSLIIKYNYLFKKQKMNIFKSIFSKPNCEIGINEVPKRRCCYLRDEDYNRIKLPAFYDKETITGEVHITLTSSTFDHNGIKIILLGIIESTTESKNTSQFITLQKELSPPGRLSNQINTFKYSFNNVELSYESYRGIEFNVRYILRVIISTTLRSLTWEREFGVVRPMTKEILKENNEPIRMDVGIEDWLHLSFELDRTKYSTKDVITGRVTFKKVSMFLKSMLLQIIRREKIIGGETDNAILCRFEIMDGAPIKNEIVPIRFFLSPYELTPTYQNVNNKFSVQYIINLVLFDAKDKRYFKQHEIVLYRIPRVLSPQLDTDAKKV
jgi:vacuolar protein sorting-associated protein 26